MYSWTLPKIIICVLAGYIIGNFEAAIIVSRIKFGTDIRLKGSHRAGSTNMLRVFGVKYALMSFAGDVLKAVLAVLLGRSFMGDLGGYIAGFFCIIGHCLPLLANFKGGRGVASTLGFALMVLPIGGIIAAVVGIILLFIRRQISLSSITAIWTFFICIILFKRYDPALVIISALIVLFVTYKHRHSIRRLIRGRERQVDWIPDIKEVISGIKEKIDNKRN